MKKETEKKKWTHDNICLTVEGEYINREHVNFQQELSNHVSKLYLTNRRLSITPLDGTGTYLSTLPVPC